MNLGSRQEVKALVFGAGIVGSNPAFPVKGAVKKL